MDWKGAFAYLGIVPPDLLAGLLGGLCKSFSVRSGSDGPYANLTQALIGAVTANYLGVIYGQLLFGQGVYRLGACFATGIAATFAIAWVLQKAQSLVGRPDNTEPKP